MMTAPAYASQAMPPAPVLSPWPDRVLGGLLALFGFVLPMSTAAVSVGLAALLAFALLFAPALWRTQPWRDPVIAAGLALLGWIVLHTAWTSGLRSSGWEAINSYHELLMAALLFGLFRLVSQPQVFLHGLMAGIALYALAHWLAPLDPRLADYLRPRYISAGYVMAVTAFVLLDRSRHGARHPRLMQALSAFLVATVVFTIEGRTGQLLVAALAAYAAWCWAPRRWRLPMAAGLLVALLAIAFTLGAARDRIPEMVDAAQPDPHATFTSTKIRIGLLTTALEAARHHGVAGVGFAKYVEAQEESARRLASAAGAAGEPAVESLPWLRSHNPHNEFLMQLVSGGLVSLGLFMAWLLLPLRRRDGGRAVPSLVAMTLAFAIGSLFNSLLLDFTEAHFHLALLAWLLARAPAPAPAPPSPSSPVPTEAAPR